MDAGRPALRDRALRRALPWLIGGVPVGFAALFFVYPLTTILARGLTRGGGFSFPSDVLCSSETARLLWFTTWQAAASTLLTLAAGLPLAWVVGRFSFPGRGLVRALVLVPFVLPTVVVATAFLALLPEGMQHGVIPILLAHAYFNVAVVVRVVGGTWAGLDRRTWEAAATLGAGPRRRLREVTLPLLLPALSAASALTFLFCFTSFGVVLILGGPTRSTIETAIYDQAARAFDLRAAAALSLLQLAAVALVLTVASRLEARVEGVHERAAERDTLRPAAGRQRVAVAAVLLVSAAALGLPLVELARRSRGAWHLLFDETPALLVTPWHAAVYSVLYATAATVLALAVGGLAAVALARLRPGAIDALVLLPLGSSAVMLGFGFLIAFDEAPLDFRSSWWLIPVAQSLVATPFVIRIVAPALRGIDPQLREAAALLGAAPGRRWREIDLPLAARALGTAAGFAFAIALGEFGATVFLARADRPTLPVAIFRFLGRPGAQNQALAAVLAVMLAALAVAAALVAERAAGGRRGAL